MTRAEFDKIFRGYTTRNKENIRTINMPYVMQEKDRAKVAEVYAAVENSDAICYFLIPNTDWREPEYIFHCVEKNGKMHQFTGIYANNTLILWASIECPHIDDIERFVTCKEYYASRNK